MATRRAVANGNWSATSTWNGGVVPGNGDTVYANGFNVTLDQDITIGGDNNPTVSAGSFVAGQWYEITFVGTTSWTGIGAASNTAGTVFLATGVGSGTGEAKALATLTTTNNTAAGAAAGGSFVMSTVRAINTDIRAGTTSCLNLTATSGTLTLSGIRVFGGTATGAHGVNNNSTATVEIAGGNYTGGSASHSINNASTGSVIVSGASIFTGGNAGNALNNASTGSVSVSGSCTFSGNGSAGSPGHALSNSSTGSITVSGSCTFTGSSASGPGIALNNSSTGSISVSGSCTFTGGTNTGYFAINNASTGSLTVANGTFTASAFTNAVNIVSTSANVSLSGDFLDHWSGWKAVNGGRWRLGTTPSAARTRYALAGTTDSYVEMFTADNATFGQPAISDVRSGTVYGGGILTGTCAVPAAASVAFGVPVGNTTGTAVLTPEAVWSATNRTITGGTVDTLTNAPASVTPADIWSYNARIITGGTVDTLTNAPSVPSASAIASQVRTELSVELARVDQNISSRLAAADYTAPTAAPTVTAIRQEMDANSTKLANLDATISSRLADADYIAPTSAPTVADIRAELATELGRIDASISTRLADADYVAPTTPPTAAEIATAVESSILNEGDGQQVLNAIVGAIGNSNVDEIALVAAIRADLERTGGKLDSIPTTSAPSASTVAGAVRSELTTELSRIDQTISSRLASADYTAPTAAPTAAQNASAVRTELSVELARLDAPVSGATAPSAATVASAVRSELSSELTKVSALNTDRLANCATTQIVGTLLAQSQS